MQKMAKNLSSANLAIARHLSCNFILYVVLGILVETCWKCHGEKEGKWKAVVTSADSRVEPSEIHSRSVTISRAVIS